MADIYTLETLAERCKRDKALGSKIGFTCGAFDLLHAGHVDYLHRAKELCDILIVAVNTDASIRRYKSLLRPVVSQDQRAMVVAALADVDAVILMDDQRPAHILEVLKPDLYIKGGDYQASELRSAPLVESYGGRCVVIPIAQQISSTTIIRRIVEISNYSEEHTGHRTPGGGLVFLDRDGTLIENVPYIRDASRVRLRPGVIEGLRKLQEAGLTLVVVTNQQGIGLGYLEIDDFIRVNSEMLRQMGKAGIRIARIYFCPHSYADQCDCRKPGAALLEEALRYFGNAPGECYLIGDSSADLEAAERVGCLGVGVGAEGGLSFARAVKIILTAHRSRNLGQVLATSGELPWRNDVSL